MNKYIVTLLTLVILLMTSGCANILPQEEEETIPVETEPPTLEEILGYDGYDLLAGNNTYKYQEVHIKANMQYAMTVNDRSVAHNTNKTVVHRSDENVSYTMIIEEDTSEAEEFKNVKLAYIDMLNQLIYNIDDYSDWTHSLYESAEQYYDYSIKSNVTVSNFEQVGNQLYVEAQVDNPSDSDLDTFIKYILEPYGVENYCYSIRASYNMDTKEMQILNAEIMTSDTLKKDDYEGVLNSLSITVTRVADNDIDVVSIPKHITDSSVYVGSDNIKPYDKNAILCETLFGLKSDEDAKFQ